ncbi:MAG: HEPN domain-containing protein [Myxococcota bacterium]|nr:HEPN domain-containing protein [Myxococcota bacterium]
MTDEAAVHEGRRWLRQAEEDLDAAAKSADLLGKHYLACFLAQQAAEKALKALFYARGAASVRGRSVAELCTAAEPFDPAVTAMRPRLAKLDRYYIPTRYPNGLSGGHPFEAFDARDSADAVALAAEAIAAVRARFPSVA